MNDEPKDGGPAFPQSCSSEGHEGNAREGMTLRDYFAAQAPVEPQRWFTPAIPNERPKSVWHKGHDEPGHYCEELPLNWQEQDAWSRERDKQQHAQWPYAWADALLEAREKGVR